MSEQTPIEKVFDALQNAPNYHPASAQLFTDWLMQAGDVVTVSSDGEDFNLPIFNLEMTWNGSSMVSVDATGKEKRDAPSALQRRSYGASRTQAEVDGVHSALIQMDDKIGLVVTDTQEGAVVNTASIIAAINGGTGHSEVAIEADNVLISGNTKLSGTFTIDGDGYLSVMKTAVFTGSNNRQVSINNGKLSANDVDIKSGGSLTFVGTGSGEHYDITATSIQGFIKSAEVSGNSLILTPVYGSPITFSKATTLTGTWSGGTYTVSASSSVVATPVSTVVSLSPTGSGSTDFTVTAYHDGVQAGHEVVSSGIYLTDDTTNHKIQARWGSASGTVYAERTYSSGVPSSSDITIGSYLNVMTEPTASSGPEYTSATLMRDTILAAINNHNWFAFSVFYKSSRTVRRYKMKFS